MPLLIDWFCGQGGAAQGYADAGWDVIGVDLSPQPRYPFAFVKADCLDPDSRLLQIADALHASPPCQFGTEMRHAPNAKGSNGHLNLIPATRAAFRATGKPYVIENVRGVREHLINPVSLNGFMFGLGCTTADGTRFHLERERLFETNWPLIVPPGWERRSPIVGMYGGHIRNRSKEHGGRGTADFIGEDKPALAREAMGMPWATMNGMSEAIPPAYTREIGRQLMAFLYA
jgi:DNA (cytosine-5)-methyltransferase 1